MSQEDQTKTNRELAEEIRRDVLAQLKRAANVQNQDTGHVARGVGYLHAIVDAVTAAVGPATPAPPTPAA